MNNNYNVTTLNNQKYVYLDDFNELRIEIETLKAENEKFRKALELIKNEMTLRPFNPDSSVFDMAFEALK